jgi:uncharacterized protein YjbJ (UPF0337 family)
MDQKKRGTFGEEVSAFGERTSGAVKDAAGAVTGNRSLEREGEAQNERGRARQAANRVMDDDDDRRDWNGGYVTGIYNSPESASRAYEGLTTSHGYRPEDINVVMTDETRKKHYGDVTPGTELSGGTKAAEGFGKGSAIGGGVGAALAAIAAALAGAGAGGVTGGVIGALVGAGIPEERAAKYEEGLKRGGILIGTRARDEKHATELERDFTSYGGDNIKT